MIVYVVTRGQYDEYTIVGIASTLEAAERIVVEDLSQQAEFYARNDYAIAEWEVV